MLPPHTCMPRAARRLPTAPLRCHPSLWLSPPTAVSRRSGSDGTDGVAGVRICLPAPGPLLHPGWVTIRPCMPMEPPRKSPRHMATRQKTTDCLRIGMDGGGRGGGARGVGRMCRASLDRNSRGPLLLVLSIQLYMPEHYLLIHRSRIFWWSGEIENIAKGLLCLVRAEDFGGRQSDSTPKSS
jgi:hypothetical protein